MFLRCLPSIFNRSSIISAFSPADNDEMTISATRSRAGPDVTSPLDPLTRFAMVGRWNFYLFLTVQKLIDFYDFPWTNIFIDQAPQKVSSWGELRRLSHQAWRDEEQVNKNSPKAFIHICRAVPSELLFTKLRAIGDRADVVNLAKFYVVRWRGLNFTGCRK